MMVQEGGTPARQCCSRVRWSRMALHPGTGLQTGFYAHAGQTPAGVGAPGGSNFQEKHWISENTGFIELGFATHVLSRESGRGSEGFKITC